MSREYGTAGANGVATFLYDSTTLRLTDSRAGTTGDNNAWQDLEFFYDNNGNITRIFDDINADQHQCFTYDKIDRLLTAYTDNTSACNGHTAVGDGNYNDTYTYNAGGNLTSRTGNGTYTYGDTDHKHAVTAMSANGGSSFTYDANGNMKTRDLAGDPDQTLNWDDEQRLESLEIAGADTTEFLYDADGARVRRQTGDITTFYTPVGSEYSVTASAGGNNPPTDTCYVQVDGAGILLTWQDKAGTEVIRDSGGWVATPGAGVLTYTDATGTVNDGWLIRRGGVDETCEIYAPGGGGTPSTKFVHYYQHGGDTVGYNDDGTVTWMFTDQVNSTSLTRTGTTNTIQRYGPWGDLRTDGNLTTDRHYTGQIADNATGLAYYNARYYDPTTGRFTSADTIVPGVGNGQNYNRYSYVNNNPVAFRDPTGHCSEYIVETGDCIFYGSDWTFVSHENGSGTATVTSAALGGYYNGALHGSTPTQLSGCADGVYCLLFDPLPSSAFAPRLDTFFGFDTQLLNQLNVKETRDLLEWGAAQLGYPFGTGEGRSMGPYNVSLAAAQDVWAGHEEAIRDYFALRGESIGDPTADWGSSAEGSMGRVFAGLFLQDLENQWIERSAGKSLVNDVSSLEAALLNYRFKADTVDAYVFRGEDSAGVASDLAVWRATGLVGR